MAIFGLPDYAQDDDTTNEPQMKPISDVEKEQIINTAVDETYETLDYYVVEWADSSRDSMMESIKKLKNELKEQFINNQC